MGWLTDVGNIAVGAIERDREITKEDLAIRAENLQANRDILIKQKDAKYKKELDAYYKEKEKFDEVEKNNALKAEGNISDRNYAIFALNHSNPYFKNLSDTEQDNQINEYIQGGNTTIDYKLTGSVEEINKKAAAAQTLINNETSAAIKDAKGNSFLINQILGRKEAQEKDLYKAIESKLNASEAVKMTETSVNPDNVGLEIKASAIATKVFSKDYQNAYKTSFKDTEWNLKDDDNVYNYLSSLGTYGGNDELSLKFDKTDSTVKGMNANSIANVEFMNEFFNQIKNKKTISVVAAQTGSKNFGEVGNVLNTDAILAEMTSLLDNGRHGNIKKDPFGKKNNIRLTTFVPLNIADERNNLIINGVAVGNLNENQMQLVNGYMNEFLYNKAVVGKSKDVNAQGTITKIYRKLYKGDSKLTKEFSEYILGRDKNLAESYNKVLSTTDKNNNNDTNINEISKDNVNTDNVNTDNVNTDNNSKINYQVTKENGEDGLSINGVFNSWKKIEQVDAVKDLPPAQLIEYQNWKKTTTGNNSTIPLFNQKTKKDVITPAIKNTVKKIDNFGNTIELEEGEFGKTGA